MDCFVASLLAMTSRHIPASPRRTLRPGFAKSYAARGRRKRRVLSHTHSLMCESEKAHELQSPQVWPDRPAFPARLVLTVSFVLFPVIGLFCHRCRSRCASIVTCVTQASRRQNHTTSPSATSVTRQLTASRPSHPAPYVRDDGQTPLLRAQDARRSASDLPDGANRIFSAKGLDGRLSVDWLWEIRSLAQPKPLSPQHWCGTMDSGPAPDGASRNDNPSCPGRGGSP